MSDALRPQEEVPSGPWAQSAELAFRFLFVLLGLLAIAWCVSNIREVPPDSQAVVLRFGSVVRQQGAGLLIALPRPIEEVVLLPAPARQIEFRIKPFDVNESFEGDTVQAGGNYASFDLSSDPRNNAGFLLTGDSNVVHLQATLFYQITDPVAFLISEPHIAPALARLFIASAVSVSSGRDLDSILVARPEAASKPKEAALRERLRGDLVAAVNKRLEDLAAQGASLGITVSRVDLTAAIPTGAKMAFDQVLTVTQNAQTNIAMARTQAEIKKQATNQQHDRIMTDAAARAAEAVTDAKTRTAPIAALGRESQGLSRGMLMNRLYYDRVGALLKKAGRVETVDPAGGVHLILPGDAPP
jgi:regulator of protease activity HflC (stomatin/prohibitin superfamily)